MDDKSNRQNTPNENEATIEPIAAENPVSTPTIEPSWQPDSVRLARAVPDFDGQTDNRPPTGPPTIPNTSAADPAPVFASNINESPRKNWKPLAIGIGSLAVLLLGGSAAAYQLWYQNPDKVVSDALSSFASAKTMAYDGKLTATGNEGAQEFALTFIGANNGLKQAKFETDLALKAGGQQYKMNGGLMTGKDKLYFKVGGLKPLVDMMVGLAGPEMVSPLVSLVSKLDNRWIIVTDADLQKYGLTEDDTYKCTQGVLGKLENDKATKAELKRIYRKNAFLKAKANLGSQRIDGTDAVGYTINTDAAKAAAFGKAFKKTLFYKELEKCSEKSVFQPESDNENRANNTDSSKPGSIKLWIGRLNHELKRVEFEKKDDNGDVMNAEVNTRQNRPVDISQPTDVLSLSELQREIEAFSQRMESMGITPVSDKTPASRAL